MTLKEFDKAFHGKYYLYAKPVDEDAHYLGCFRSVCSPAYVMACDYDGDRDEAACALSTKDAYNDCKVTEFYLNGNDCVTVIVRGF